jgi:hypothetical protein
MSIKKHITKMKKHYYSPTPKKWRQLGDALLGVALMGIPADLAGYKWVGITLFAIGVVGKFITNFFKEDNV